MTAIHNYNRGPAENPATFANRFNGAVARYINHTTLMVEKTSTMFAIMLIRNVKPFTDETNYVSMQLPTNAHGKKDIQDMGDVSVSRTNMKKLAAIGKNNLTDHPIAVEELDALYHIYKASKNAFRIQDRDDAGKVNFTLDEAIKSISQVRMCEAILEVPPVATGSLPERRYSREGDRHNRA